MDAQLVAQIELLKATVETLQLHAKGVDEKLAMANGWKTSAEMVLDKLDRQGKQGDRMLDALTALKVDLTETRSALAGRLDVTDSKVRAACRKIGAAEACQEHTARLAQLGEQVRQQAEAVPDLWTEVNGIKEKVGNVKESGSVLLAEWRTVVIIVTAAAGIATVFVSVLKIAGLL